MTWLLTTLLRIYQVAVSPLLGPRCRYHPTCSAYAMTAVTQLGPLRGSWLAARRVGRCHPWSDGGIDVVPSRDDYRWWGRCPGHDGDPATQPPMTATRQTPDSSAREGA